MSIKLPIIVAEGLDISFFDNLHEAECYLEAVDVREGLFKGYDSEGCLLNIEPYEQRAKIFLAEESPGHIEDLRKLLKNYLIACECNIPEDDLQALLYAAINYKAPYKTIWQLLQDSIKNLWAKKK